MDSFFPSEKREAGVAVKYHCHQDEKPLREDGYIGIDAIDGEPIADSSHQQGTQNRA